jgi:tRNA(Ile)-lysidine synthase
LSLQKNHFDQLFKPYKKIALAVSGGADSIAMLYMLYDWSIKAKKTLVILSVNHNLRLEAKEECEYVSNLAKSLGLESVILEWKHDGIFSNVHKKAREARYELMTNWCKENGLDALCTAHHMDDRCENFFIRISQGAGILGLIDKEKITYNDVAIIRPIFNSKKADLVKYLEDKKIKFYYDISNQDKKYLRTNIREMA